MKKEKTRVQGTGFRGHKLYAIRCTLYAILLLCGFCSANIAHLKTEAELQDYINNDPNGEFVDHAKTRIARIKYYGGNYGETILLCEDIIRNHPKSHFVRRATLLAARAELYNHEFSKAKIRCVKFLETDKMNDYLYRFALSTQNSAMFALADYNDVIITNADTIIADIGKNIAADPLFTLYYEDYNHIRCEENLLKTTRRQKIFCHRLKGNTAEAESLEAAFLVDHNDANSHSVILFHMARSELMKRELDNAVITLQTLLTAYPESEQAARAKVWIASIQKSIADQEAYQEYDACLVYFNDGKFTEAIPHFQKTVDANNDWAWLAAFRIAQCYEKLGQVQEAMNQYQFVIVHYPDCVLAPAAAVRKKALE